MYSGLDMLEDSQFGNQPGQGNLSGKKEEKMRKIALYSILMVFSLTLFAGCASMTGETAGEKIDDSKITTEANAIIVKDPDAHYLKISVTTTMGDVVLTGFVNSRETEDRLVSKIRQIHGVKSVTSHLNVESNR